ncbi:PUA-like domain-containing protein [Apodospora peruviana]|uniref:PUA-like domain-containing protein n=1 Tax=Apodospora peruviana TaxID=516989 RepID=A0AAE0IBA2_9PEZI|nr:PUA-like domain-containing protein [Apodospora peruviana]
MTKPEDRRTTAKAWVSSIQQGILQLRTLLVGIKNKSKITSEHYELRYEAVKAFLHWLLYDVQVTPALRHQYRLDKNLALPNNEIFRDIAPLEIATMAAAILERFNDENWGADAGAGPVTDTEEAADIIMPSTPIAPETPTTAGTGASNDLRALVADNILLPPPSHPIWGIRGIMHGITLKQARTAVYCLDPRYVHEKRNPKVFGHNGLTPGDWWPFQRVAHFHGAHGAPVRGITGSATEGAYSIVTSGGSTYEDLDQDFGDKLFYSADSSRDNTDRNNIAFTSNATMSLHKSLTSGRPVRVLRNSGGKKAYTPKKGIRYDGLYRVHAVKRRTNAKGGLYEQFELKRLSGQRSLDDINAKVPSPEQLALFARIKNGY